MVYTLDTTAWTGVSASFMHPQDEPPRSDEDRRRDRFPRASVWRLRHDCRENYSEEEASQYAEAPINDWEPCGSMAFKDIELELHDHLRCPLFWEYSHWTWLDLDSPRDKGFRADSEIAHWPAVAGAGEDKLAREGSGGWERGLQGNHVGLQDSDREDVHVVR